MTRLFFYWSINRRKDFNNKELKYDNKTSFLVGLFQIIYIFFRIIWIVFATCGSATLAEHSCNIQWVFVPYSLLTWRQILLSYVQSLKATWHKQATGIQTEMSLLYISIPANTRHSPNDGLALVHRPQRRRNIKAASVEFFVLAGMSEVRISHFQRLLH